MVKHVGRLYAAIVAVTTLVVTMGFVAPPANAGLFRGSVKTTVSWKVEVGHVSIVVDNDRGVISFNAGSSTGPYIPGPARFILDNKVVKFCNPGDYYYEAPLDCDIQPMNIGGIVSTPFHLRPRHQYSISLYMMVYELDEKGQVKRDRRGQPRLVPQKDAAMTAAFQLKPKEDEGGGETQETSKAAMTAMFSSIFGSTRGASKPAQRSSQPIGNTQGNGKIRVHANGKTGVLFVQFSRDPDNGSKPAERSYAVGPGLFEIEPVPIGWFVRGVLTDKGQPIAEPTEWVQITQQNPVRNFGF